jgi:hypothetical protein
MHIYGPQLLGHLAFAVIHTEHTRLKTFHDSAFHYIYSKQSPNYSLPNQTTTAMHTITTLFSLLPLFPIVLAQDVSTTSADSASITTAPSLSSTSDGFLTDSFFSSGTSGDNAETMTGNVVVINGSTVSSKGAAAAATAAPGAVPLGIVGGGLLGIAALL